MATTGIHQNSIIAQGSPELTAVIAQACLTTAPELKLTSICSPGGIGTRLPRVNSRPSDQRVAGKMGNLLLDSGRCRRCKSKRCLIGIGFFHHSIYCLHPPCKAACQVSIFLANRSTVVGLPLLQPGKL